MILIKGKGTLTASSHSKKDVCFIASKRKSYWITPQGLVYSFDRKGKRQSLKVEGSRVKVAGTYIPIVTLLAYSFFAQCLKDYPLRAVYCVNSTLSTVRVVINEIY